MVKLARWPSVLRGAVFALVLLVAACHHPADPTPEEVVYPYLEEDLATAWRACASFRYIPDAEPSDSWKSPREFEQDAGGDCEDFSTWLTYHLGMEASVLGVQMRSTAALHAIVEYRVELIEPAIYGRKYKPEDLTVLRRYSYAEVMALATAGGTK